MSQQSPVFSRLVKFPQQLQIPDPLFNFENLEAETIMLSGIDFFHLNLGRGTK